MRQLQGQCQARAAQGSGGTRIPLEAGEGRGFPQKPHGDDLFVPPVSLDSSGDASHLASKYGKKEELRHLNPFHSKISLNRYHCATPLNSAHKTNAAGCIWTQNEGTGGDKHRQ